MACFLHHLAEHWFTYVSLIYHNVHFLVVYCFRTGISSSLFPLVRHARSWSAVCRYNRYAEYIHERYLKKYVSYKYKILFGIVNAWQQSNEIERKGNQRTNNGNKEIKVDFQLAKTKKKYFGLFTLWMWKATLNKFFFGVVLILFFRLLVCILTD